MRAPGTAVTTFVSSRPTARKPHWCDVCGWRIMPGETYQRAVGFDGTAWTWRECLWCERIVVAYARGSYYDECATDAVVEWLQDEHPIVYAAMRAGWRYPDGERLPLPFPPP